MSEWVRLASAADVREGEALPVDLAGTAVALYRVNGEIHALDDTCTHEFALLSQGFVEDGVVECPLHAAQFEVATGKCLCGPATEDLKVYAVRVEGDDVFVRMPEPAGGH